MPTIERRASPGGIVRYRARVRLHGAHTASKTFRRKTDAQKWAQKTEVAIRQDQYAISPISRRKPLSELIDRYVQEVLPRKPKTAPFQRRQLEVWRKELGHLLIADVTPARIVGARQALLENPGARQQARGYATTNRYLAVLSHAFTCAVDEWGWAVDNPVRKVKRLRESRGRTRFLSDDERVRLLAACRVSTCPYLYPIVVVAISTGMRRAEILTLRKAQVDVVRGVVSLQETKNGEPRCVPLAGLARDLVRTRLSETHAEHDLLFPGMVRGRPLTLWKPWKASLVAASVTDLRFHDLRHTAASYLAMNGATALELAAVLGHKTLQMVKRYAHLSEDHAGGVVASMNTRIFGEVPK
ncbi:Putative defective protein IntQ [Burkholderiales bacterium]|nr:Putative defective protein IntQ [Burkholderiales bacterium]